MDSALITIRKKAKNNELTYAFVMDCLKSYANPRNKLSQLLKSGALIRIKKGIYTFHDLYIRGEMCKELLANLIYGPSYISLEWAMSFYGFIPEKVEGITSVSYKATKDFDTPVGHFSYKKSHSKRYPIGITLVEFSPYQTYHIATKEKALCDLLLLRRGRVGSAYALKQILFEDFRIDMSDLKGIAIEVIRDIQTAAPHSTLKFLVEYLETLHNE